MATSKLQSIVVREMDRLFGSTFVRENIRPKWLLGLNGERLELDVFIPSRSVAIEVQGAQHYRFSPHFHATPDDFIAQQSRDAAKRAVCATRGIRLWEIASEGDLADALDEIQNFAGYRTDERLRAARDSYVSEIVARHLRNFNKEQTKYVGLLQAEGGTYRGQAVSPHRLKMAAERLAACARKLRNTTNQAWADALRIKNVNDARFLQPRKHHEDRQKAIHMERRAKRVAERPPGWVPPVVAVKEPRPKRRRGCRGGRGKSGTASNMPNYSLAFSLTAQRFVLKQEIKHRKGFARLRVVAPISDTEWRVSGGECEHLVALQGNEIVCIDHQPAHRPPADGRACSHEIAVRRFLTQQILAAEVAA